MAKRKFPSHPASQSKPTVHTVTNPDRWDRSHGTYLSGRACIDGADATAVEMERRWGCDRLRLLVSNELREKFDRQRYLFSRAIENGSLEDVRQQSARMVLAWTTLDADARAAGHDTLPLTMWEVALEDGTVAIIVPDTERAQQAIQTVTGRKAAVYTLEEVGRILGEYRGVVKAKLTWPGATVTRIQKKGDPLDGIGRAGDFDDPLEGAFDGRPTAS